MCVCTCARVRARARARVGWPSRLKNPVIFRFLLKEQSVAQIPLEQNLRVFRGIFSLLKLCSKGFKGNLKVYARASLRVRVRLSACVRAYLCKCVYTCPSVRQPVFQVLCIKL